jgi:hypothetical protein
LRRGLLVAIVCAACGAPAQPTTPPRTTEASAPQTAPDAATASVLATLKELEGAWQVVELGDTFPVTFEIASRGGALVQRSGFLGIWHADGDAIALALFPDDGYHARLRSRRIAVAPDQSLVLELATVDVGNVSPAMTVARSVTMTVSPNRDRIMQRWVFRTGTKDDALELVFQRRL